jgi:hypothetical protein
MAEFEMRWTKKIFGNTPLDDPMDDPTKLTEIASPTGSGDSVSFVSSISEGFVEKSCTCPKPTGPAEVGREYSPCPVCGYTWRCPDCSGCCQCELPSRKVKTTEGTDLPFPIGYGGLDSEQVARAERINLALGVTDPLDSKLSVVNWLYQYYRDLGNHEIAEQLKQAYWQLREPDRDLVCLSKMGEADQETLLRRLRNGQKWLTREYETRMVDNPEVTIDEHFQRALDTWVQWETHLRIKHGWQGCIHPEGQRCPDDSVISCDACATAPH